MKMKDMVKVTRGFIPRKIQWHIHTGWWSLVNWWCQVLMRHYIRGSWILMRTAVSLMDGTALMVIDVSNVIPRHRGMQYGEPQINDRISIKIINHTLEFFLNVSLNSANSVTKIFVITVKGLEPTTSWVRDRHATTAPARHMLDTGSLNWLQFMFHWFIRFLKFAEFTEISSHLRKTSLLRFLKLYLYGCYINSILSNFTFQSIGHSFL